MLKCCPFLCGILCSRRLYKSSLGFLNKYLNISNLFFGYNMSSRCRNVCFRPSVTKCSFFFFLAKISKQINQSSWKLVREQSEIRDKRIVEYLCVGDAAMQNLAAN